ncbi:MAG: hypothetical protein M3R27_01075 [Bacteroidota bacterium]|nr:hypothetical protein [Bacteroidota bacterium]
MKRMILAIVIGGIIGAILILILMLVFKDKNANEQSGIQLVTNDSTSNNNDPKKQQVLVYGDYMDLDSTDFLLIPLGMKTLEGQDNRGLRSKSSDEYTESESSGSYRSFKYNFYSLDFGNCNNIIFFNKVTDETHLLLQNPAIISQFYFPFYDKEYQGEKYWFILLGIREDDSNADGYINTYDAEKVYLTDLSGRNMKQITPDNTQLVDWFIDMPTNSILMKVRFDTNKDLKFNYYDEIEILKTSIDAPYQARKIIADPIKEEIRNILKRIK